MMQLSMQAEPQSSHLLPLGRGSRSEIRSTGFPVQGFAYAIVAFLNRVEGHARGSERLSLWGGQAAMP
jgi:hypothetical protein